VVHVTESETSRHTKNTIFNEEMFHSAATKQRRQSSYQFVFHKKISPCLGSFFSFGKAKSITMTQSRNRPFRTRQPSIVLMLLSLITRHENIDAFRSPADNSQRIKRIPKVAKQERAFSGIHPSATAVPSRIRIEQLALSEARKMGGIEFKKINLKHSHAPSSFSSSTDKTAISPLTAPFEKKDNTKSLDSTAGFLFAATVVLMLSISSSDGTFFLGFSTNDGTDLDDIALATATRVIDVAVPTSSDGYFAVALGESIAGVIGAVFSVVINFLLRPGMMMRPNQDQDEKGAEKYSSRKPFVSQALADGDYFIANGASNSLLVAIGVSPEVAKFCSVFIAAVPSELVKLLPNIQEQRSQEELILQQLLLEQKEKEAAAKKKKSSSILSIFPVVQTKKDEAVTTVNPGDLVPVTGTVEIDFVEVFADVTRWLEYE
jgi:hypothetical protein